MESKQVTVAWYVAFHRKAPCYLMDLKPRHRQRTVTASIGTTVKFSLLGQIYLEIDNFSSSGALSSYVNQWF